MSAFVGEGATSSTDDRPLTDQEYQLLQRLLSDPFSLPQQFKTWLVSYLEGSDLTLPMSAILGLSSLLGISGAGAGTLGIFPAGVILPWGADLAPTGAALCDGASYATTGEYQRLFDAIKYRYGGSGSSFNVPDLRDRVPVGVGAATPTDTIGKHEGKAYGARSVKHGHSYDWTPETPQGWHNANAAAGSDINDVPTGPAYDYGEVGNHEHRSSLTRVGVNGTDEAPSFVTINFVIIK